MQNLMTPAFKSAYMVEQVKLSVIKTVYFRLQCHVLVPETDMLHETDDDEPLVKFEL